MATTTNRKCRACGSDTRTGRPICGEACLLRLSATCPQCGVDKPCTPEHWAPMLRHPETREILRFDGYCRPCRRALQADKYRTSAKRRADACARARAQRERRRRRREADPEYDLDFRRWRREYEREYRARRRSGAPGEGAARAKAPGGRGGLPAKPLADFVYRLIDRVQDGGAWRGEDGSAGADCLCATFGIDARTLRAWASGERRTVHSVTADRILTQTGYNWWDVWDPGKHPEAERLAA